MTGGMASMQASGGENGPAIKEIESNLPDLDSAVEAIESILPHLPTSTIRDFFIYQQVKAQYAEKDILTDKADQELENIKKYEPNLEAEVERCKANIRILQDKVGLLHTGETIEKITLAESLQNEQLFRAEELYGEMRTITERASRIIGSARSKTCPPYIPRQEKPSLLNTMKPTFPFRSPMQPKPDYSFDSPYSTGIILDDLLKLRPSNKIP